MTSTRRRTLRDIAESLDLSVNTVSRALAGKEHVSVQTRQLIEREAERIGYVPNNQARSLVRGSAMTIGLVITNPSNPFYAQLISSIELAGRAAGYSLMLGLSEESPEVETATEDTLLRSGVDGAVIVPVQAGGHSWSRLRNAGVPVVLVNRDLPGLGWDMVATDNALGVEAATRAALRQGARSIVLFEEDLPITTVEQRIAGFRRALDEAGLSDGADRVITVPTRRSNQVALPWQADEGYRLAQEVLSQREVDAIVVGNDYFALGVYKAISERGLRIPDDIAVVGFGDYPFSGYLNPPLTTVRLPAAEVGRAAFSVLLERLNGSDRPMEHRLIAPALIERGSSRSPTTTSGEHR